jgi:hypothetical protein
VRQTYFETVPFDLSGTSPGRSCNLPVQLQQLEDARKNRKNRERGAQASQLTYEPWHLYCAA